MDKLGLAQVNLDGKIDAPPDLTNVTMPDIPTSSELSTLSQTDLDFDVSKSTFDSITEFNKGEANLAQKCYSRCPPCEIELCIPDIHVPICKVPDMIVRQP